MLLIITDPMASLPNTQVTGATYESVKHIKFTSQFSRFICNNTCIGNKNLLLMLLKQILNYWASQLKLSG